MHVCSIGSIRPSNDTAASAPGLRHIRRLLLVTASIGLLSIGQVVAQEAGEPASAQVAAAPAAEQTSPSAKPGKNGKVCKNEDITGSRMKKRICQTPEQWEARERAAREMVRELDSKPVGKDANGG